MGTRSGLGRSHGDDTEEDTAEDTRIMIVTHIKYVLEKSGLDQNIDSTLRKELEILSSDLKSVMKCITKFGFCTFKGYDASRISSALGCIWDDDFHVSYSETHYRSVVCQFLKTYAAEMDWVNIVVVLAYTAYVAAALIKNNKSNGVHDLIKWCRRVFAEEALNFWIKLQGGWSNILKMMPRGHILDEMTLDQKSALKGEVRSAKLFKDILATYPQSVDLDEFDALLAKS